jgi:hypothetical protein
MSLVKKISALVGTMIGSFLLFMPSAFAQTVAAADTLSRNTSPLQPASVLLLPQLAVQWLRVKLLPLPWKGLPAIQAPLVRCLSP